MLVLVDPGVGEVIWVDKVVSGHKGGVALPVLPAELALRVWRAFLDMAVVWVLLAKPVSTVPNEVLFAITRLLFGTTYCTPQSRPPQHYVLRTTLLSHAHLH